MNDHHKPCQSCLRSAVLTYVLTKDARGADGYCKDCLPLEQKPTFLLIKGGKE